ncbi:MAG: bacillithiol system redox-active protein YtxJ [Bacteroidota bacterium]
MNWNEINDIEGIDRLKSRSYEVPCLLFKHSTRCEISAIAKYRLESDWSFAPQTLEACFLDLIRHRDVSNFVADTFQVHHESPQVLLIVNGECIYDASHLDIRADEIAEALGTAAA